MSSPELQLGFVLKVEDSIFCLTYSSAETIADTDLQPIVPTSDPTGSNTVVSGSLFFFGLISSVIFPILL